MRSIRVNLAIERFKDGKPLPNGLTDAQAANFSDTLESPFLDYPRIFYYIKESSPKPSRVKVYTIENAPKDSWYVLHLNFFDLTLDYLDLIPEHIMNKIIQGHFKLVMFYQEADNPLVIEKRLIELCEKHNNKILYNLHNPRLIFFSGNSEANNQTVLCHYWPEIEYMFRRSVDFTKAATYSTNPRAKKFVCLNRVHKYWRACAVQKLYNKKLTKHGHFSYLNIQQDEQEPSINPLLVQFTAMPLDFEFLIKQRPLVHNLLKACPLLADNITSAEANNYSNLATNLYQTSYFNFTLESFLDMDSSNGIGISEKSFKPILHNQPFIIAGPHLHLQHLRDLGYKTFSRLIDESYDEISDTTKRLQAVTKLMCEIANKPIEELHELYIALEEEIIHNRKVFEEGLIIKDRLDRVVETVFHNYYEPIPKHL
jgi:hypothetical protein